MLIFILHWHSFYLFFFCVSGLEKKIAKSEILLRGARAGNGS
jgi:hypothetical protein